MSGSGAHSVHRARKRQKVWGLRQKVSSKPQMIRPHEGPGLPPPPRRWMVEATQGRSGLRLIFVCQLAVYQVADLADDFFALRSAGEEVVCVGSGLDTTGSRR